MERFIFYFIAAIILVFSVLTVSSRRILRAAVYLLFVLLATAGLYFLLNYNFLAAVQLTVYSGGIVVLIVFAILLTAHLDHRLPKPNTLKAGFSGLLAVTGLALTLFAISRFEFVRSPLVTEGPYGIEEIGTRLLSYGDYGYVLPFEVISVLLLAAMVAAIIVAKKSIKND